LETENLDEKHWANVSQLLHMFKEDLPQTKIHVQCSTFVLLPGMDMDPMDTWPSPALGVRGLHFSKKSKQIAKKAFSLKFFGLIRGDGCSVQPPWRWAFINNKIQTICFNLVKGEILDIPFLMNMLEHPRADGQQHVIILNHFRGNVAQQMLYTIKEVFLMIFLFIF
jgi:hypothetical protein